MVEAAVVLPLFLILCLVFFEFVRIVIAQAVATYAALKVVKIASGAEVAVSTTPSSCAMATNPCTSYLVEWDRAVTEGEDIARLVASASNVSSGLQLVAVDHYDPSVAPEHGHLQAYNSGGAISLTRDVMLLRPGERGLYHYPTGTEVFDHVLRGYGPTNQIDVGWPAESAGENWGKVLESIPLASRVVMLYTPVVPGLPSFRIVGHQFGNVRVKTGGLPQPVASASNSPSPTPSASPSSSITPSPSPSMSVSPSASQSPQSPSSSASHSPSASVSASPTSTPSMSVSPTPSPSFGASQSPSVTPSHSPSVTPSVSPSQSITPSVSPSQSITPSVSPSQSVTPSLSPSASPSPSQSPLPLACSLPPCNIPTPSVQCDLMIADCTAPNGNCPCPAECGCCPSCPDP